MTSNKKNKALELNPNVSIDNIIFGFDFDQLYCLLIDSGISKTTGRPRLAVPGDLIYDNETLDEAAKRILKELTGIRQYLSRTDRCFWRSQQNGKRV